MFVQGIKSDALLVHAEEIQLTRSVQRIKQAEEVYAGLIEKARRRARGDAGAPERETSSRELKANAREAAAAAAAAANSVVATADGLISELATVDEWSAALNLSVPELRVLLREGQEAKERIVKSNVRLVGAAIQSLKNRGGGKIYGASSEQDMMQEGCMALIKAAQGFDVSLGCRFSTYATLWVRAALRRVLQEQSRTIRVPSRVQDTYSKIKRAESALLARSGQHEPSDDDVSAYLDHALSPEKIRQIVQTVQARTGSLDAPRGGHGSTDERSMVDTIEARPGQPSLQDSVVVTMLRADLRKTMEDHLTEDERAVVALRFGLEDGDTRTVRGCGEELGISYANTKSLLFKALTKLRKPHVAQALQEYARDDDG